MTVVGHPGLRERKKREIRERIRTAAIELFVTQGYHETTMEQVAAAADVAPRTVYRHFPTKDALVVTDEDDEVMLERFRAELADRPVIEAFERAFTGVLMIGSTSQSDTHRRALLTAEPELQTALMRFVLDLAERYAGAIVEAGRTDVTTARALAGAVAGAALMILRWDSPQSTEQLLEQFGNLLRNGFDV